MFFGKCLQFKILDDLLWRLVETFKMVFNVCLREKFLLFEEGGGGGAE